MTIARLLARLDGPSAPGRDGAGLGTVSALGHQLTLSACLLVGLLLLDDARVVAGGLFWTGQGLVHLLTLSLLLAAGLERATGRRPPWMHHLLVLLPVADLLILAVSRWSLTNVAGFQGFLMAVPTVWLAAQRRYVGVAWGLGASLLSLLLGFWLAPAGLTTEVLSRGLATTLLVGAMGVVVASVVLERDERARRLELVSSSLGVVEVVLEADGSVTTTGALRGPGRGVPVHELLRDPVFAENGRFPLPPERNPLARARRGSLLSGEAIWTEAGGRRIALSVSSFPLREGRTLVLLHDVTASLSSVLQEEQFLAGISHELKTPLTSIAGYVELLEDEAEGERPVPAATVRGHLAVVARNVERLQSLIMGLLETARTVTPERIGSEGGPQRRTSLTSLLREQVEAVTPRAEARRLTLRVEGLDPGEDGTEVELVNADHERLGQAIDNLLSNAVTYSHEGGAIEVTLRAQDARARLTVADHGIGIDVEDLDRLFTPYFRAGTATRAGIPGYGLGLMITRRIVRAHGGELEIASRVGEGTSVTMDLPLVRT